MHQHINYKGPKEEGGGQKQTQSEKKFEVVIVQNSSNMGKELVKFKKGKESHKGLTQGKTCQDTYW